MNPFNVDAIDWAKADGLVPTIVQDADSLRVLMMGWMNRDALSQTLDSGLVTFFSRSRGALWTKGESSGNTLTLVSIDVDCDADTLLVQARPAGPTCHLGRTSCFPDAPGDFIGELAALISRRRAELPKGSYTTKLFESGLRRIAQKVGEEGVETALAAVAQDREDLEGEAADLLYHLLVLLTAADSSLARVREVLSERHR